MIAVLQVRRRRVALLALASVIQSHGNRVVCGRARCGIVGASLNEELQKREPECPNCFFPS